MEKRPDDQSPFARDRFKLPPVIVPILLVLLASLAAGLMAYGTSAAWAAYPHGLSVILWVRRLEWPLGTVAVIACIALFVMIIAGRRRAWWLIGLGPVLALFAHRLEARSAWAGAIVEYSANQTLADDHSLSNDAAVVGLMFDEQAYAFPYDALFRTPVVIVRHREKEFVLIWSADANRAVAASVDLDLHARDLEIVSTPVDSLLIYNTRLGQFIVGVTGKTESGATPTGFHAIVSTVKTTASAWMAANPQSQILPLRASKPDEPAAPTGPIQPRFKIPETVGGNASDRVTLIAADELAAVDADAVGSKPANLTVGTQPIVLLRDGPGQSLRAFDSRVDTDLYVHLRAYRNAKKPTAEFADDGTASFWSHTLVAIEGGPEIKGKKLQRLAVDENVCWGVMKYWYPALQLYSPSDSPTRK